VCCGSDNCSVVSARIHCDDVSVSQSSNRNWTPIIHVQRLRVRIPRYKYSSEMITYRLSVANGVVG